MESNPQKKYKVKQGAGNTNNADDRSGLPTRELSKKLEEQYQCNI